VKIEWYGTYQPWIINPFQMNLRENYKGVSFDWHYIHNEFVISIMNTYYNEFMDKEGKT